ncbi:MAG: GNAT family N-acetyltransferase [Chloroflexi bacterium]|nr:GNAT family N-acetyltransferase [Chloroflexota bacterium]
MSTIEMVFQSLDLGQASENEYACLSQFKNILRHEYLPDDPPIPLEEHIQGWKNIPQFVEYEEYIAWDTSKTKIIACGQIAIYNTGDNEHLADFMIEVLPEYRNQGIAGQALGLLLPFAKKHERTLWMTESNDRIPASSLFLECLGARRGLETFINQLKLVEFDRNLVDRWLEQSKELKNKFELMLWNGAYPDAPLTDITELFQEVANDQPRDTLEMEDQKFTPQIMRDMEKSMFARGTQRWSMFLTDRADGKLAGLTEVFWNPNRVMILDQGFTGVYPAHRSKGLGRWLKAEMMQKILRDHPEVEIIRTRNANSNAPMLKINVEMGFKPYIASALWQVETDKIEKYLTGEK